MHDSVWESGWVGRKEDLEKLIQEQLLENESVILDDEPIWVSVVQPGPPSFWRTCYKLKGYQTTWVEKSSAKCRVIVTNKRLMLVSLRGAMGVGENLRPNPSNPIGLAINLLQLGAKVCQTSRAGDATGFDSYDLTDIQIEEGSKKGAVALKIMSKEGTNYLLFHGLRVGILGDGTGETTLKFAETIYNVMSRITQQKKPEQPRIIGTTYCPHCQTEIPSGSAFCWMCGRYIARVREPKEAPQAELHHLPKPKPEPLSADKEILKSEEQLAKLDALYRDRRISKDAYEKLKQELQRKPSM